jgi:hypothetical protein
MSELTTIEINPRQYRTTSNPDEVLTIGNPKFGPGGIESCVALAFTEKGEQVKRALAHIFYNGMKADIEIKEITELVDKMTAEFTPSKIKPAMIYIPCFYDQNTWKNPAADFVKSLLQKRNICLTPEDIDSVRTYEQGVMDSPKAQPISAKLVTLQPERLNVFYKNRLGRITNSQNPVTFRF